MLKKFWQPIMIPAGIWVIVLFTMAALSVNILTRWYDDRQNAKAVEACLKKPSRTCKIGGVTITILDLEKPQ